MRQVLFGIVCTFFLLACSQAGPNLLNIGQKSMAQNGDFVEVDCGVKNAGKAFKGLKLSLAGSALVKDMVRPPAEMTVELLDMSSSPQSKTTAKFEEGKDHTWAAALPDLEVDQPFVSFHLAMPASCSGQGDVILTVGALDGTGTSAVFTYPCMVDSMAVARAREARGQAELKRIRDLASPPPSASSLFGSTGGSNIELSPEERLRIQADRARTLEIKSRNTFGR